MRLIFDEENFYRSGNSRREPGGRGTGGFSIPGKRLEEGDAT
jgi:hypothetical protein